MKIIPRIHGSRAVSKHIGAATCRDSHVHTDQHTAANHALVLRFPQVQVSSVKVCLCV